ncbi:MAG: hypothetical protein WBQ86_09975 [Candidatus Binatus sp.]
MTDARSMNVSVVSLTSRSFAKCVMRCGAFSAKRKLAGVRAAHPSSIADFGIARNV